MRTIIAFLLGAIIVAASACSAPEPRTDSADASPCDATVSDSARIACAALAAIAREDPAPARISGFKREGSGYCVITYPTNAATVDGGAVVLLDSAGVVKSVVRGDSVGCSAGPDQAPAIPSPDEET